MRKIYVVKGCAEADSEIVAFHKSLKKAGLSDLNLIYLSSVIPPNSVVIEEPIPYKIERGNIGYVVMSKKLEKIKGKEAWSGLAWIYNKEGGFFIEATHNHKDKLIEKLKKALKEIREFEKIEEGIEGICVEGIKCRNKPVCSVVCAFYFYKGGKND